MAVLMPMSICKVEETQAIEVRPACACVSAGTEIFNVHSSRKMLWPLVLQKAHHDCRPSSSPKPVRARLAHNIARSGLGDGERFGCKPLGSPKWPHAMQSSRAQVLRATLTHNRIGNLAAVMLPCAASLPTDAPGGLSC